MRHALIAVVFQLILMALTTDAWVAAFAADTVFFMREITQAEYRCIEKLGGVRSRMHWLEGLNMTHWNRHSIENVATPALATFLVALTTALHHR